MRVSHTMIVTLLLLQHLERSGKKKRRTKVAKRNQHRAVPNHVPKVLVAEHAEHHAHRLGVSRDGLEIQIKRLPQGRQAMQAEQHKDPADQRHERRCPLHHTRKHPRRLGCWRCIRRSNDHARAHRGKSHRGRSPEAAERAAEGDLVGFDDLRLLLIVLDPGFPLDGLQPRFLDRGRSHFCARPAAAAVTAQCR